MADVRAGYESGSVAIDPVADALAPAQTDPWRWSADGEALLWHDPEGAKGSDGDREGETVLFREELRAVLARLAPEGLPPISAVILLLAACRDPAGSAACPRGLHRALLEANEYAQDPDERICEALDRLAALPRELRAGTPARALLAEVVFERAARPFPPPLAARVVKALEGGLPHAVRAASGARVGGLVVALGQLATGERGGARAEGPRFESERLGVADLARGLLSLDADALRLRARTGLERLPAAAAKVALRPSGGGAGRGEAPACERARALIRALSLDEELAGLGEVAADALAALRVPRPAASPEDLPVGGFADIANKGPLDRLLLSELAHDDLTLAVRIAEREALYLRREAPRRTPSGGRALLLDAGIRLWGVPRVFLAAVALALAAGTDPRARFAAFRASGDAAEPTDVLSKEGLAAHLEALEPAPHPAAALAAFAAAARLGEPEGASEAIVCTHERSREDRDLAGPLERLALERPRARLFVATVAEDGRYRLLEVRPRGPRPVASARLDLRALTETPEERERRLHPEAAARRAAGQRLVRALRGATRAKSVLVEEADERVPSLLRGRPPLLLPLEVRGTAGVLDEGFGLVAIAGGGRPCVMHAPGARSGARVLADGTPPGRLLAAEAHLGRAYFVFLHEASRIVFRKAGMDYRRERRLTVLEVDPAPGSARTCVLDPAALAGGGRPLAAWIEGAGLVVVERRAISLHDLGTGARVRRFESPRSFGSFEPLGKRYVLLDGLPRRVYVEASAITLAPFPLVAYRPGPTERPIALVDRPGQDEPLLVTREGVRTPLGELVPLTPRTPRPLAIHALRAASSLRDALLVEESAVLGGPRRSLLQLVPASGEERGVPLMRGGAPVRGTHHHACGGPFTQLEPRARELTAPPGVSLLRRLRRIGAGEAGQLVLEGRRGRFWLLSRRDARTLVLQPMAARAVLRGPLVPFEAPAPRLEGAPPGVLLARFAEGSAALFDPRGILHLRSADRGVGEVAIALGVDFTGLGAVLAGAPGMPPVARLGGRWFHDLEPDDREHALPAMQPLDGHHPERVVEAITAFARRLG